MGKFAWWLNGVLDGIVLAAIAYNILSTMAEVQDYSRRMNALREGMKGATRYGPGSE